MNMANLLTLAAAVPSKSVQATGWFLETAWLIPALPALSFFLILFFGKKMKYKGAEFGITAIAISLILAICCVGQWMNQVDNASDNYKKNAHTKPRKNIAKPPPKYLKRMPQQNPLRWHQPSK